jgi:hypothetical protein
MTLFVATVAQSDILVREDGRHGPPYERIAGTVIKIDENSIMYIELDDESYEKLYITPPAAKADGLYPLKLWAVDITPQNLSLLVERRKILCTNHYDTGSYYIADCEILGPYGPYSPESYQGIQGFKLFDLIAKFSLGELRCTEEDEAIALAANAFIKGKCEEFRE